MCVVLEPTYRGDSVDNLNSTSFIRKAEPVCHRRRTRQLRGYVLP